jgi:hypothetical protein
MNESKVNFTTPLTSPLNKRTIHKLSTLTWKLMNMNVTAIIKNINANAVKTGFRVALTQEIRNR